MPKEGASPVRIASMGQHVHAAAHATAPLRRYRINAMPPQATVGHCCDSRFHSAIDNFLREERGIVSFMRLSSAGSAVDLIHTEHPEKTKLFQELAFCVQRGIPSIVLITHEDCKWYHDELFPQAPAESVEEWSCADHTKAAQFIRDRFPEVEVHLFQLKLTPEQMAYFVPIPF